jgi:hypothetical protein
MDSRVKKKYCTFMQFVHLPAINVTTPSANIFQEGVGSSCSLSDVNGYLDCRTTPTRAKSAGAQ